MGLKKSSEVDRVKSEWNQPSGVEHKVPELRR
jgi:hypothetical protein